MRIPLPGFLFRVRPSVERGEIGLALVAFLSFLWSADSITQLALRNGAPSWKAWLLVASIDGMILLVLAPVALRRASAVDTSAAATGKRKGKGRFPSLPPGVWSLAWVELLMLAYSLGTVVANAMHVSCSAGCHVVNAVPGLSLAVATHVWLLERIRERKLASPTASASSRPAEISLPVEYTHDLPPYRLPSAQVPDLPPTLTVSEEAEGTLGEGESPGETVRRPFAAHPRKAEALDLLRSGKPQREVAEEVGVSARTLRNWVAADQHSSIETSGTNGNVPSPNA